MVLIENHICKIALESYRIQDKKIHIANRISIENQ